MRRAAGCRSLQVLLLLALGSSSLSAQEVRSLAGRVLDATTQQPIGNVLVRVQGTALSAVTSPEGQFRIDSVPLGTRVLELEHLGYEARVDSVVVGADSDTILQLRMTPRAVQLPGVVVEGRTELEQRRQSTGFSMNEIRRPAIESAARRGMTLWELLQEGMPQVSVRDASRGIAACVEFRGGISASGGCQHMAIFVDGVHMSAPGTIYPNIPLDDIERVEAISPGQAGVQYGTLGGSGVLLIETRTGPRPNREGAQAPLVFGFDWEPEARPYPWPRVVGSALVANALGLTVGIAAARGCLDLEDRTLGVSPRCGHAKAFGAGSLALILPVVSSALGARWGGTTDRSQGRVVPALVLGSAVAVAGYLAVIEGQEAVGAALLTVGLPSVGLFADRFFRALR